MESNIFFMLNPFLHILGKATKNFDFDITGVFIFYCNQNSYPLIEKISQGDELLSSKVHRALLSKDRIYLGDSYATVSSKNCEQFNETIASLWLIILFLYRKGKLTGPELAKRIFWLEFYKLVAKKTTAQGPLPKIIFLEMFQIWKKEPVLVS